MQPMYLVLHNIRSAYNVGSLLRTADTAGVSEVLLCGITPTPHDRFGRARKDIAKVALGVEQTVSWIHEEDTRTAIEHLKIKGVTVVAVEQTPTAVSYTMYKNKKKAPTAFILGEETNGLPEEVLTACDAIVEIPMYGKKESLNVSVAGGIVLFRFIEQCS